VLERNNVLEERILPKWRKGVQLKDHSILAFTKDNPRNCHFSGSTFRQPLLDYLDFNDQIP
jgi:hypothetical protein